MPKGLKVSNQTGHIFYDTAWIAGVDYAGNGNYDNDRIDPTKDNEVDDATTDIEEDNLSSKDNDNDLDPNKFRVSDDKLEEVDKESKINEEVASDNDKGSKEKVPPSDDELPEKKSNPSSATNQDKDVQTARSSRVSRPPVKLTMLQIASKEEQYSIESKKVITTVIATNNVLH